MLSSVWTAAAATPERRRAAPRLLAGSSWGDPGSDDPEDVHLALRLAWARGSRPRCPRRAPGPQARWRSLLAAELFVAGRPVDGDLVRRVRLGGAWAGAGRSPSCASCFPRRGVGARRRRRRDAALAGRARVVAAGGRRREGDDPQPSGRPRGRRRGGGVARLRRDAAERRARAQPQRGGDGRAGGLRCPLLDPCCRSA